MHYFNPMLRRASKYSKRISCRRYWPLAISESAVLKHSTCPVNQLLYDSLLLLQHRGQDAAGIATAKGRAFYMHKASGMVRDVFHTRNMRDLPGTCGIGQVRYPTTGTADCNQEAQPFYINAPYGIVLAHNGN